MMDYLEHIDQLVLRWINGMHHPVLDEIFWNLSKTTFLIPFFAVSVYFLLKEYALKKSLILLLFIVVTIFITDVVSTQVFKEGIQRYRPSHNLSFGSTLHLYEESPGVFYKGGKYGFFSSHAANLAGFLCMVYPFFKHKRRKWLITLSIVLILVCYSRMYLGVHYPSDILAGILFGSAVGTIMRSIYNRLQIE